MVQQQQPKQNQPQVNKVPRQPVYDFTSSSEGQGSETEETEDESEEEESEEETPYHLPAHDNRFATLGKMQVTGLVSFKCMYNTVSKFVLFSLLMDGEVGVLENPRPLERNSVALKGRVICYYLR